MNKEGHVCVKILEPRLANEQRVDSSLKRMANPVVESHPNGEMLLSLCTFCNNPTSGLQKKLFATEQTKGPFFPILANLQGSKTKLDLLGRAVVCGACFHHLLRQWSGYERRGVPHRKREYKFITDDCVNNYQIRREEEIRREAELKIKEVQHREERIRQEAEQRYEEYRQRQEEIRREAEERLLEEKNRAEQLKKETQEKLKAEQRREDDLMRQAEKRIQEEKEKRDYIRQEAERLLREERLLEAERTKQGTQCLNSELPQQYTTEVVIHTGVRYRDSSTSKDIEYQKESGTEMEGEISKKELSARTKSRKMMVFDPETGCYRKKSEIDDEEDIKPEAETDKVEYHFRLRSEEERGKPEATSEESVRTEHSIIINAKNRPKSQDPVKEKVEEDKKKSAKEPSERKRTKRSSSDESLEEKIREMEKRRERLLLRGPSFEAMESRTESPDKEQVSPREEHESPRSLGEDGTKKKPSRSERNKRRLTAEKLSRAKGEEDVMDGNQSRSDCEKVEKTEKKEETFAIQSSSTEKQIEKKEQMVTVPLNRTQNLDEVFIEPEKPVQLSVEPEKPVEVFVEQAKPVEAGAVDLMNWDDDSTDGRSSPEKEPLEEFRKRADSSEGETFPKPLQLVEIEAPITVTQKQKEHNEPVNIMDIDNGDGEDSEMSTPIIESISTWDKKSRVSDSADEDRKRREREHEERKRRIEENQRRGAQDKAKKQASVDANEKPKSDEPFREMTMKEKRRSLVDMWESFSEPQTQVISFEDDDLVPIKQSSKVVAQDNNIISFDQPQEEGEGERVVVETNDEMTSNRPAIVERNEKLTEEEQRWEKAENFQPGRLQKTVFHSMVESAPVTEVPIAKPRKGPSRYDWMRGESSEEKEALVPTKLKLNLQTNQEPEEIPRDSPVKPSSPQPMQNEMEMKTDDHETESSSEDSESTSESESEGEEERKPRIDSDEYHKLTKEEKQWESAGHFQPKKLNISLMASFQQAPLNEGGFNPVAKKTQESSRETSWKPRQDTPRDVVSASSKLQRKIIEVEEVSLVNEVKAETQPETFSSEEESESDDDIPGWRKVEEQRRQQERQEIERAKQEEKLRMEREAMEKSEEDQSDSSNDEFEAKVRPKEIRRIDPNVLVQFLQGEENEPEIPVKLLKLKTEEAHVEASYSDLSAKEEEEAIYGESQERTVEDEYEEKVKNRQIGKLKIDNSPFLQKEEDAGDVRPYSKIVVQKVESNVVESAPPADFDVRGDNSDESESESEGSSSSEESESEDEVPEWRKIEERRRQQEQEEIKRAKLEEQTRREREAMESEKEDTEKIDDEFEAKVRTKEIRKINPNLLFQFMGSAGEEEKPASVKREEKKADEIQRVEDEYSSSSSSEDSDTEEEGENIVAGEEDEYEIKVKRGQVSKLVLSNSPFMQMTTKDEPQMIQRRPEAKKKVPEPAVLEEELIQVVDDKVIQSEPDMLLQEPQDGDEFEVKVKSRLVKKLSQDQFGFLRKKEEEERRKAMEEERRKAEREEREMLRKEEERKLRLEAEVRAKEEEKIRKEEEIKRKEQGEKARKEEERRRKIEEAERVRQEEEERARREEEEEQIRLEEMRKQKLEAKKRFESGVFDEVSVNYTDKDIYNVGRLDSNIIMQFQKSSSEEPKINLKGKNKETKVEKEKVIPEPLTEAVVMASVDVIETSPYDERFDVAPSEDLEFEEKRKNVGKLDKDWYIKQQQRQVEEQSQRARELEQQRLREEKDEMLRIKQEKSNRKKNESAAEPLEKDDSEKTTRRLSVDKLSRFENGEPKKSRKKKGKSKKEKKRKSVSSEDGSDFVPVQQDEDMALLKMRLQKERDDSELLREEEKRRLSTEVEQYTDDKPRSIGKLNHQQFAMFQKDVPNLKESKKSQQVEEIVKVQSQNDVESVALNIDDTLPKEDAEYELKINKCNKLDVEKYLSSRSQEAVEGEKRAKKLAEERLRQEQEEQAKLRAEEKKRQMKKQKPIDEDYKEVEKLDLNFEIHGEDTADKRLSVGRLPEHFRSTFEGDTRKQDKSSSRKKSSKRKGSSSHSKDFQSKSSRSLSYDSLSIASSERDFSGTVSTRESVPFEEKSSDKSLDRSDSSRDVRYEDRAIEFQTTEEKPVPKKLDSTLFAAFEKSDRGSEVHARRAKSEKNARPKSIANVDLLSWKDDENAPPSSTLSKKEKSGRMPRPKSIAY